jgi:IS5 family transposase
MRPKKTKLDQFELFQARLEQIISLNHPLCKLAKEFDWDCLDNEFGKLYTEGFGRPGLATRLMVGLHYLKYAYDESDESVVARFLENPYWQYFCGFEYFQHELPLDPTSLVKWRHRIGEGGAEELLKQTIETARNKKLINKTEMKKVNVDTTVQEKAISFPTDADLYQKAREILVQEAKKREIKLRQTYKRVGKKALIMQSRYRHARQMKRANREVRRLSTYLGRVIRDVRRKCPKPDEVLAEKLLLAERIYIQQRTDKKKLYSMHAPEVAATP